MAALRGLTTSGHLRARTEEESAQVIRKRLAPPTALKSAAKVHAAPVAVRKGAVGPRRLTGAPGWCTTLLGGGAQPCHHELVDTGTDAPANLFHFRRPKANRIPGLKPPHDLALCQVRTGFASGM